MKNAIRILQRASLCALAFYDVRSDPGVIPRSAVESSSIASIGYVRATQMLEIEFRTGAIYRYRDVPETVSAAFSRARSKGKFFSTVIRGKYDYDKVPVTKK